MKLFKMMTIVALSLGVAGCASISAIGNVDTVSRNAPLETGQFTTEALPISRSYVIEGMYFSAPEDISVSEANSYYPQADVVWRGDPVGDRVEQIGAIFNTAADRNKERMIGDVPIVVDVQLVRFHGVTERTRFSVGGVYNIVFDMQVRHAETGEVIEQSRRVLADLSAPGGVAVLLQEQRGQTEKVRVTDFLTQVFKDELSGTYDV